MQHSIPLILLPGLLCDEFLWEDQAKILEQEREVRVIPLLDESSMEVLARKILLQAPQEFYLAGFSMGGYCALEIIRQQPWRVKKLAMVDSSARADEESRIQHRKKLLQLCDEESIDSVIEQLLPQFVSHENKDNPGLINSIRTMAQRVGCRRFKLQQTAIMGRKDQRDGLREIDVGTMILHGSDDELTPRAVQLELERNISTATRVEIPSAGHFAPLENAPMVTMAMKEWLMQ